MKSTIFYNFLQDFRSDRNAFLYMLTAFDMSFKSTFLLSILWLDANSKRNKNRGRKLKELDRTDKQRLCKFPYLSPIQLFTLKEFFLGNKEGALQGVSRVNINFLNQHLFSCTFSRITKFITLITLMIILQKPSAAKAKQNIQSYYIGKS